MTATLSLLADMPRTGVEVILWLATIAGLVLFHSFLNAALGAPKKGTAKGVRPV